MHILSIDPGGKGGETGVSIGHFSNTEPYSLEDYIALPSGPVAFMDWYSVNLDYEIDVHIVEDFIQWEPRSDPSPLELIGLCKWLFQDSEVYFRPANKKSIIKDNHLKTLGAYVPGGHHRDVTESVRHAVAWLVKDKRHLPTMKVLYPQ